MPLVGGGVLWRNALQLPVVPPFTPAHDQLQGPEPETEDAVPVLQRFVVGTDEKD